MRIFKRSLAWMLALCMVLSISGPVLAAEDSISSAANLDLTNGSVVITQADGITTFKQGDTEIRTTAGAGIIRQSNNGTPTENTITVENGTVDLTISGINILASNAAPINIKGDAEAMIQLKQENTVAVDRGYTAGVEVAEGAALTISGSGALTATGGAQGAGIGGGQNRSSGTITINGGSITATGGTTAAAIGGGSKGSGTVIINGGVVNAIQKNSWPGAAIGSGDEGKGSTITITGGTVTATAGLGGVAIGGGITGSTISITGGTVTATGGGNTGAGIGSNSRNAGGSVYISNANVTASGYYHAIGGRGKGNEYGLDSVVIEDSATVNLSHRSSEGADVRERIVIDTPVADMTTPAGENVTFSVEAHGASGLTYQWQVSPNGSTYNTLAGETADTLSVTVGADNDGYTYSCLMTNGWGNKLASEAKVYMEKPADRGIEYTINRMGMYDIDTHEEYKAIPKDRFFVEIEVTNECSAQVDAMMIVQYSPEGQMLDLDYLYSDTEMGKTALFGTLVDNRDGSIGCIKAFVVPTVGSMIPLAESMEIGEVEEQPADDYTMAVMVAGNTATIVVEGEMPADSGVKVMLWKDGKYSNVGYASWIGVADGVHTYEFINNMTADYEFAFQLIVGGEVLITETIVIPC